MQRKSERRLQRKARSRSDAPGFVVAFGTAFIIFGGIDRITTGSVVVGNGCTVAISTGDIRNGTGVRIGASIGGGAGCASSSRRARW